MTTPIGEITITPQNFPGPALTLATDPDTVETIWDPRKTTEAGLEGVQTTQDWGQFAIDCTRRFTWSGNGQWLDKTDVQQLRRWLGTRGATLRYEDYEGNDWVVELVPPFSADPDFRMAGAGSGLYTARLMIHVLSMNYYLDELYTGD